MKPNTNPNKIDDPGEYLRRRGWVKRSTKTVTLTQREILERLVRIAWELERRRKPAP